MVSELVSIPIWQKQSNLLIFNSDHGVKTLRVEIQTNSERTNPVLQEVRNIPIDKGKRDSEIVLVADIYINCHVLNFNDISYFDSISYKIDFID